MLLMTLQSTASDDQRRAEASPSADNPPSSDSSESIPADYFLENAGQLGTPDIFFYTTSGNTQIGFAESAAFINTVESESAPLDMPLADSRSILLSRPQPEPSRGVLVRLDFEGANKVAPEGRDMLPQQTNFFIGNDSTRWREGVRSYMQVVYEDLYEGIDLVYRMGSQGLKYDFIVRPGADPALIRMTYTGIDSLDVSPETLILKTAAGDVRDGNLVATAGSDSIRCEFARVAARTVGFACDGWNRAHALVIDPLLWATFLGGGYIDYVRGVAVDASGYPVVGGETFSSDFPATPGAYDITHNGDYDGFVAKLSKDGSSLMWATYFGGTNGDRPGSIALDSFGNSIVTGFTESTDFPATPGAWDVTYNGGFWDAFVAKLSPDGSSMLWATYLGGVDDDRTDALSIDDSGNAIMVGFTSSADFPTTTGAYDVTFNGPPYGDAFAAKLSADGSSLLWATFFGQDDAAVALVLDAFDNPVVAGYIGSAGIPVTPGAYDVTYNGGALDAFVAKLSADGSTLLWATYAGADGSDRILSLSLDALYNPVLTGLTDSINFPVTPGAYDVTYNGGSDDAFVAKLSADGSALLWATYLGGSDSDYMYTLALDGFGNPIVAGITNSTDFPVTPGAYDVTLNGGFDAFVAKLSADGSAVLWATYLGGSKDDYIWDLALDASGTAYAAGFTASTDVPVTTGAYDTTYNGGPSDAFVARLWILDSPIIDVLSPSGGEVWTQGDSRTVTWKAADGKDAPSALLIWINYTSGAGSGIICGPVAGNVGFCDWTLPMITASDVVVNGTVIDTDGLMGYDESGPFTIQAPPNNAPTITVTSPSGGEVWTQGSPQTVTWTASDNEDAPSALLVWVNYTSGAGSGSVCGSIAGNVGSCPWTLPSITATDVIVNGTVVDTDGLKGYDESGQFTIQAPPNTPPTITITSPSGGEVWIQGSSHPITWMASDNEDASSALLVWINYTSGAGSGSVCGPVAGTSACLWTLPSITATDVVVNGTVIDTGGLRGYDESGQFTIQAAPNTSPTITVMSPSGGEVWTWGSFKTVTWTASDNEDLLLDLIVWINYTSSAGSGNICGPLAGSVTSCFWTVPAITATDVVVNGTVIDTGLLKGFDDSGTFTVQPPPNSNPTIAIISPAGGEVWIQWSSQMVTWAASDNEDWPSDLVVWINYTSSAGGGSICGHIAGNVGSCVWTLPMFTAADVVINGTVIDTGGLKGYDESGQFTIRMPPNTPPTIAIASPTGGEVWIYGSYHTVTWTASDNEDSPSALLVWINYTSSAGSGVVCGRVAGDAGSCAWTLPTITATDVVVNGTVIDTGGLKGWDQSGPFTIRAPPPPNSPPTVVMISPVGGEEWFKGSTHTINWTMHDDQEDSANLVIYINYTTGGIRRQVATALIGQTSFEWTLPDIEANDVVVNITVIDTGGLKGWSQSGPFTIKAPPPSQPDFLSQYWWLILAIVVVAIALLLFALIKRKKPEEETSPPQQQSPPPNG